MTTAGASPCSVSHILPPQEQGEPAESRGVGQTLPQMGSGNWEQGTMPATQPPARTAMAGGPLCQPLTYLQPLCPVNGSQRPQHPQHPQDLHHRDGTGPGEEGTAELGPLPCPGQAGTTLPSSQGGQAGASSEGQGMAQTCRCHWPSLHKRPSDSGSWRKQLQTEFYPQTFDTQGVSFDLLDQFVGLPPCCACPLNMT